VLRSGGNGTTILTGFWGQLCACAKPNEKASVAHAIAATNAPKRYRRMIEFPRIGDLKR